MASQDTALNQLPNPKDHRSIQFPHPSGVHHSVDITGIKRLSGKKTTEATWCLPTQINKSNLKMATLWWRRSWWHPVHHWIQTGSGPTCSCSFDGPQMPLYLCIYGLDASIIPETNYRWVGRCDDEHGFGPDWIYRTSVGERTNSLQQTPGMPRLKSWDSSADCTNPQEACWWRRMSWDHPRTCKKYLTLPVRRKSEDIFFNSSDLSMAGLFWDIRDQELVEQGHWYLHRFSYSGMENGWINEAQIGITQRIKLHTLELLTSKNRSGYDIWPAKHTVKLHGSSRKGGHFLGTMSSVGRLGKKGLPSPPPPPGKQSHHFPGRSRSFNSGTTAANSFDASSTSI